MLPLDLLSPGERARVVDIDGEPELVHRLKELGIQEGTELQLVQSGNPCIIAIDNQRFSFRGENAAAILVEPLPKP